MCGISLQYKDKVVVLYIMYFNLSQMEYFMIVHSKTPPNRPFVMKQLQTKSNKSQSTYTRGQSIDNGYWSIITNTFGRL